MGRSTSMAIGSNLRALHSSSLSISDGTTSPRTHSSAAPARVGGAGSRSASATRRPRTRLRRGHRMTGLRRRRREAAQAPATEACRSSRMIPCAYGSETTGIKRSPRRRCSSPYPRSSFVRRIFGAERRICGSRRTLVPARSTTTTAGLRWSCAPRRSRRVKLKGGTTRRISVPAGGVGETAHRTVGSYSSRPKSASTTTQRTSLPQVALYRRATLWRALVRTSRQACRTSRWGALRLDTAGEPVRPAFWGSII